MHFDTDYKNQYFKLYGSENPNFILLFVLLVGRLLTNACTYPRRQPCNQWALFWFRNGGQLGLFVLFAKYGLSFFVCVTIDY